MRPIIVRIFSNSRPNSLPNLLGRHLTDLETHGIRVFCNQSGKADLVIVLSVGTFPCWVVVPKGNLIKILQEPVIRNPLTHLFTYRHSRVFDQVLTHAPDPDDLRQVRFPPCIGSFVDITQLESQPFEQKKYTLSIIMSRLNVLPGHHLRLRFIEGLLKEYPHLEQHTFGRGRERELQNKIDGLQSYRYSIAVENTKSETYITEKFSDCIIAGCVPLYYGAPDIADYFPADSFIQLPIDNLKESSRVLDGISEDDYRRRIPALIEARALIRDKYSLGAVILSRVAEIRKLPPAPKRLIFVLRFDGFVYLALQLAIRARRQIKGVIQKLGGQSASGLS